MRLRHDLVAAAAELAGDTARRDALTQALGAPVTIRVSPRARRMSLRVDAARRSVALVLPRGVAARRGLDFVEARRGWIANRLAALPAPVPFADGAVVPLRGVPHRIIHVEASGSEYAGGPVAIAGGEIRVRGAAAHVGRRVRDHLVALARREFAARARIHAAALGRSVARVGVRDTKSRWGSCSARGALSFSWRLILAPDAVIDYVVAHEVAHLAEMNHGPRFWRVVAGLVDDPAAPRAWLARHRAELFAYG